MRKLRSGARCIRCDIADPLRLVAVQLLRSVVEGGRPRSRSIPVRVCLTCIRELAAMVRRPPLATTLAPGPWTHRLPPRTNSCVVCQAPFQAWHRRAKYCSERCRQRSYIQRRRAAQAAMPPQGTGLAAT
jgi:hypothetical protein